ncbi:MAG: hypothetical protein WBF06_07600 [Candidatus Acidiferrales bacterium]
MNISSYNVTDVGYHYIGIRVLASLPKDSTREAQFSTVSRNVLKYASDKALRLMLSAPRGDFQSVGEKVCQELVHLGLAKASHGKGYSLTEAGEEALQLLNSGRHLELRHKMIELHFKTYDNLREVFAKQLDGACIWNPVVDAKKYTQKDYIERLVKPTVGSEAAVVAAEALQSGNAETPKKTENLLRDLILRSLFPGSRISVPLFRSMCDRLLSLRLLNIMKATVEDCEFAKSYSPCRSDAPTVGWYTMIAVNLANGEPYSVYLSEPNMKDARMQQTLLAAIEDSFSKQVPQAGYYDLPQVRDVVCEKLMVPEAAFDEGINELLDLQPSPVTVGLTYEGISGRRKPLVRNRGAIQVFNLIRRV